MKILNWLSLLVLAYYLNPHQADARSLESITPESYLATKPSPERKSLMNFIINQTKNLPPLTQAQIDASLNNPQKLTALRIQIVSQKLYSKSFDLENRIIRHRSLKFIAYLQSLLNKYVINDVDFVVHLGDGLATNFPAIPSFIMSKDTLSPYEANLLLIPDEYMTDKGWLNTINEILPARTQHPWGHKENKIFWRGAATGGVYNMENLDAIPRLTLVRLSNSHPDIIDAQFSSYVQIENSDSGHSLQKMLENSADSTAGTHVKEANHLKYKYLISIDGNTCAWKRVPWIMLSNSVLIKQETAKTQWFYSAIKPYIHYLPVDEHLTNLFSQLEWLKTHDAEAQQISNAAHSFVQNELMPANIEAHMALILNEYHKIHGNEHIKPTLPAANDLLTHIENLEYKNLSTWNCIKLFFKISFRKLKALFASYAF